MYEGSSYCVCGSKIKGVSDAAKIMKMVMSGPWVRWNLFRESQVKVETKIFGRQARHYGLSGREGERGVDYFRSLLRETDEKEFCFRGFESKIVRRHPRRDESASGLKIIYSRLIFRIYSRLFLGVKDMKSCISSAYRRWEIDEALMRKLRGVV